MVDWMIEVLGIFRQSTETIFRSIFFLDLYLKLEGKARAVQDLHLLGVVAMFLASKLGEVRPLKMKTLLADICKGKFEREAVMTQEKRMLKVLGFKLNYTSISEYSAGLFRVSGIPQAHLPSIEKYAILLQKMFLYSSDILTVFSFAQLAVYSSVISLKLFEHSKSGFSAQKYVYHLLKVSGIPRGQMLENLNFLRDYASSFRVNFPFNRLQPTNRPLV